MHLIAVILTILVSFTAGMFSLLSYMLYRLMSNRGWDKSNITNALRVLSHVVLHPTDFARLYYMTPMQVEEVLRQNPGWTLRRPFWYVTEDEFSEVVKSRPTE